jgi:hypothetical protein
MGLWLPYTPEKRYPVGGVNVIGLRVTVMRHNNLAQIEALHNRKIDHRDQVAKLDSTLDAADSILMDNGVAPRSGVH